MEKYITFLEIENDLEKVNEISPVHNTVMPFVCSISTDAIRSGKRSSTPKISAALEDTFSRETQSEAQIAMRAVGNKLWGNVIPRKYSLHPTKYNRLQSTLTKKL